MSCGGAATNDERNFQRLLEDYLPLLRSTVYRMRQKLADTIEADELHSIGLSGLVVAAQKYQTSQRETFPGYAATRIRGAILDELRRQDSMSRHSRAKAKRLGSAISKLQQEQGANYSRDALCVHKELHDAINDVASLQIRIAVQNERIAELERRICVLQGFMEQAQHLLDRGARQPRELLKVSSHITKYRGATVTLEKYKDYDGTLLVYTMIDGQVFQPIATDSFTSIL
jgi:RNA polymerase sigma factor (sigma-70 family)